MRLVYELGMTTPHTTTTPDKLLTVAEVAGHLAVDPATVRRWITGGKLPATRLGRDYRIHQAELHALVAAHRTHTTPLTTGASL